MLAASVAVAVYLSGVKYNPSMLLYQSLFELLLYAIKAPWIFHQLGDPVLVQIPLGFKAASYS